ncbi:hypothetical protein Belba_1877 [Belliella baltica DSM 15883]|uniref:Uncharacterized protein n=1 Tax=Belliella baltica (strain DSM 15883 / CIP 108006 / LMG 21964 / BA134) TaxID=866536 RepID=I3Z5E6_BELBD|nr:hypothetical protein Belba_1877 [Belliella baltica DSM 15883]
MEINQVEEILTKEYFGGAWKKLRRSDRRLNHGFQPMVKDGS